jgi:hypothetical protein
MAQESLNWQGSRPPRSQSDPVSGLGISHTVREIFVSYMSAGIHQPLRNPFSAFAARRHHNPDDALRSVSYDEHRMMETLFIQLEPISWSHSLIGFLRRRA